MTRRRDIIRRSRMPLLAGTRLGPYSIEAIIGTGGMGEVYRARDTRLDRIVAIKVLSVRTLEPTDVSHRFEREARAVSALNHPHICTLYDVGKQEGVPFLVMEYLEGETLAERVKRGPMPVTEVRPIGKQVAEPAENCTPRPGP